MFLSITIFGMLDRIATASSSIRAARMIESDLIIAEPILLI